MKRLPDSGYLSFPFRMDAGGAKTCGRESHVKEQIMQVLFTSPRERVFRPEFGAGVRRLVFEPNAPLLHEVTRKRLMASLSEALQGEVDPRTLEIEVPESWDEELVIRISYTLARIRQREVHTVVVGEK